MHKLSFRKGANFLEKRINPIVIVLVKVIGGHFLAGAARAATDIAKSKLEAKTDDFKTFEEVG